MSDLEKVVACIPIGITEAGWEVLKSHKSNAIELIDECLKGCENSISEANLRGKSDRAVFLPYLNSCKKELNRIKGVLQNG